MTFRALVLFDIDGTLVRRAGPHHREALVEGVRRVTGLETTTEGIPVQGMLDPDILGIMLRRAGASRALVRQALPGIQLAASRHYRVSAPGFRENSALPSSRCSTVSAAAIFSWVWSPAI